MASDRITDKDLDNLAARINLLTSSPEQPWKDGKACIGNYHISHAYGGVCVHRMQNERGGIRDVLNTGHVTKRELFALMTAYVAGLQDAKES